MAKRLSSGLRRNGGGLAPAQVEAVAGLFGVLAEPSRLRILQMLHDQGASVGEIVERLKMKQANVSKQLGILFNAGVLGREKQGNVVRYSIRMPLVLELCDLMCERLKQEAERRARELGS
jgi:DNA-binding transcriptional ArsR family regulator